MQDSVDLEGETPTILMQQKVAKKEYPLLDNGGIFAASERFPCSELLL